MRVFMRESLMKKADQAYLTEIMTVAQHGMDFYKDLFGKNYSFSKYDQVFVPEFVSGAMENVGCVTFSENLLHLDELNTIIKKDYGKDLPNLNEHHHENQAHTFFFHSFILYDIYWLGFLGTGSKIYFAGPYSN